MDMNDERAPEKPLLRALFRFAVSRKARPCMDKVLLHGTQGCKDDETPKPELQVLNLHEHNEICCKESNLFCFGSFALSKVSQNIGNMIKTNQARISNAVRKLYGEPTPMLNQEPNTVLNESFIQTSGWSNSTAYSVYDFSNHIDWPFPAATSYHSIRGDINYGGF